MKILVYTAMFPPIKTGTSFYAKNLCKKFSDRGHEVLLFTAEDSNQKDDYPFQVERLPAIHINIKNYFKHLKLLSINIINYFRAYKKSKHFNPDVILLINHYQDIAFLAIVVAKLLKKPLYISVGTQLQSYIPIRNKILKHLDKFICGNFIFPHAKKIIAWDNEILRYLSDRFSKKQLKKVEIINYGVNGNIDNFTNYKHDYNTNYQIIGVGAVTEQRNFLFHIDVFNELLKNNTNIVMKIIGHVYYDNAYKKVKNLGLEDKIIFVGEQTHDHVLEEMKKSFLHWNMLSGDYVGLGTGTIEAMLTGLPIVSNIPQDLLGKDVKMNDMENYIHTNGKDIDLLVNKIESLLIDPSLRKRIGENGRKIVEDNLNWDKVATEFELLFKK